MQNLRQRYPRLIKELGPLRVKKNEPVSVQTTFKIGGPADLFFEAYNVEELTKVVGLCQKFKIPYFVLGRGSNILVSNKGFSGLVIKNKSSQIKILRYKGQIGEGKPQEGTALIEADSGVGLNRLVRYTIEERLSGLEVFLSIPGSVGGAIKINAHFRPERDEFIGNFVYKAKLFDQEGEVKEVTRDYFKFGYDKSVLQKTEEILISVVFQLDKVSDKKLLWKKAQEAVEHRKLRQPMGLACSGCIFKNPPKSRGAGFLIDQAGLKGIQVGGAKISEQHANFIVNTGGATAENVVELIRLCKKKVKNIFGIRLKEEIEYIGF